MISRNTDGCCFYTAMLCELKDKYFVETLLCSGGGKTVIHEIQWGEVRMKKWQALTVSFLLALSNTVFAQIADVTGVGEDSDSALRDAKRNAVEQVIGTYISSETLVSQASVVSDEIYAKAVGFVTDVQVLDEGRRNGSYYLHAKINVNTNPNSELMNRIEMIKALGDPRIGVIVTYYGDIDNEAKEKYPLMCEAAINSKLAELGFSHVVNSAVIFNEKNLDRRLDINVQKLIPNTTVDYLVVGKLDLNNSNIILPRYSDINNGDIAKNIKTNLINSLAELSVDIMKASSGEVVNSFRVEGKTIQNNYNNAGNASINLVSLGAAKRVKSALSKKAANVDNTLQLHIEANSYNDVMDISKALKNMSGVSNVHEQNYDNGKSVISIETTLKPQTVFRILKDKVDFNIFMKNVTVNDMIITTK